jgi:hypothetical protein
MNRRSWYLPPLVSFALLSGSSFGAAAKPPTSIAPDAKTAPVRVSHRHRAVVECRRLTGKIGCFGRIVDADTAAVVRFERTSVMTAAFDSKRAELRAILPHQLGPQEQTLDVPVGSWLVDWVDADKLERLEVEPGRRADVALVTTSGGCQLEAGRCELRPGVREARIRVSQGR